MTGRSPERTCAQPEKIRVIPENEIPPAMRVDIYCDPSKEKPSRRDGKRNGVHEFKRIIGKSIDTSRRGSRNKNSFFYNVISTDL